MSALGTMQQLEYTISADPNLTEPRYEAAFFYGLFLRGYPLQKLREDIDVPPQVLERWKRLALHDPWYQTSIERILNYRRNVLAIFDSLVFKEMERPTRLQ
jgi:hypothetical protein